MGRKPAPQPLALAESALLASDRSPAETSLQALSPANSFAHSKSPRSPNSVLRYGDKNSQAQSQSQTQPAASGSRPALHLADLINQPLDDSQASSNHYTPLATPAATSPNPSTQQRPPQPQQPPPPQPQQQQQQQQSQQQSQQQAQQQSQQQQPQQPPQHKQYGHGRYRQNDDKASKSNFFFHFGKSSRSTERLVSSGGVAPDPREGLSSRAGDSSALSRTTKSSDPSYADHSQPNPTDLPIRSNTSQTSSEVEGTSSSKKGKPKTFGRMGRTRSKNGPNASPNPSPAPSNAALNNSYNNSSFQDGASMRVVEQPERTYQPQGATKTTAASQLEPPYSRDKMANNRNQSGDRTQPREVANYRDRDRDRDQRSQPPSFRDTGGYTFFNGLKNSSSRAADMISKGLFGKTSRSGSTTEREPAIDDEHYVLKVINRPLVEQVRMTRISKRLEDSRDKTEFWMPAFPWRAIDYLNFKGTDVEGLYRVPGSGPQIKKWQRKFDEDLDVDLLAQDDLYDINIIGSMLKAWLRELPDELFPKEAQERVARECAGAEKVPQLLIDELANLSPFNYYLLFAITCHLSLLLAHSDKNKMDFRNLCICFQPCMKIDAFSFKFLVCDWRECWKGCVNEARYIEEEYRMFALPPPAGIAPPQSQKQQQQQQQQQQQAEAAADNRQISSSDGRAAHPKKPPMLETGSVASNSTASTTLTSESQRVATPPAQSGDLRPLSPIKPLSPLGF